MPPFFLQWGRCGASIFFALSATISGQAQSQTSVATEEALSPSTPTKPNKDIHQLAFEQGVRALLQKDYDRAAAIFERVYSQTKSERVRLEWARALFLGEKYAEAETLFKATLQSNPPLAVQDNIKNFLEDIQDFRGRWDYDIELVKDSNPNYTPSNKKFFLFGLPFTYQPTGKAGEQFGLGYKLNHTRVVDKNKQLALSAGVSGRTFSDASLNRTTLDAKASWRFRVEPRFEVQTYYEETQISKKPWNHLFGARILHNTGWKNNWHFSQEFKINAIDYNKLDYLDGNHESYQIAIDRAISAQTRISASFYIDQHKARETPYAYAGHIITTSVLQGFPAQHLKTTLKYTLGNKQYEAADPLFGLVREDKRKMVELELEKTNWRIANFTPVLTIGLEDNSSNISINTYKRNVFNLALKKSFR